MEKRNFHNLPYSNLPRTVYVVGDLKYVDRVIESHAIDGYSCLFFVFVIKIILFFKFSLKHVLIL